MDDLERRSPGEYGTVRFHVDLLEEFGPLLGEPHCKHLRGKIWELRPGRWRVTYFCDPERRFILLTSCRKVRQKTDPREIGKAERLMRDWLRRMESRT
jgi:hypothetical protein